ncbi:putative zinc finger cchc-type protein [Golovinomyces cichoracearum]|uniref:Putative zinc finger cchc-type protein n=1 Tax=Golovinomyces cichoracearum TaxID=62708 RepID=A0A420IRB9_9PEZI|nr:putative zinc finger cchc-type protein [Golovinomyces cichoracearum]
MRNHNIEVLVKSARQRDATLNVPHPNTIEMLRKDYPIQVSEVLLSTTIGGGKNADKNGSISKVIKGLMVWIPAI